MAKYFFPSDYKNREVYNSIIMLIVTFKIYFWSLVLETFQKLYCLILNHKIHMTTLINN